MMKQRPKSGLALPGTLQTARARAASTRAAVAQSQGAARAPSSPPRPELLPPPLRGGAAQARTDRAPAAAWAGAPRPELLPSKGPAIVGGRRQAAQPRSSPGVATALRAAARVGPPAPGPLALQPSMSYSSIVKSGGTSGGGSNKGGGGTGGKGGQGGGTTTVKKKLSPPTIIITKAARKHYRHHNDSTLPSSDPALINEVLSSLRHFEDQQDGTYYLDLGDYNTKRTYGGWEPRNWYIIIRPADLPNSWLVIHYGPSS